MRVLRGVLLGAGGLTACALLLCGCPTEDCGDGVADPNEACDDGASNANQPNACRVTCEVPICGDNIVDDLPEWDCEQCDGTAGCENDCRTTTTSMGVCGNGGMPEPGEDCDDGNLVNRDGCESNCTVTPAMCLM